MSAAIALLRAVNVGGHNRVPMAELRRMLGELDFEQPRTLLQSGNAVFGLPKEVTPRAAERAIADALQRELGLDVAVIARTRAELAAIVAANPLRDVAGDPKRQLVVFLGEAPDPERVAALDPEGFGAERFAVEGSEVHVWCPDGVHKAKLSNAFLEKRLGVTATGRNWATVTKLLELAESI